MKKMTLKEFIRKAKAIHGNKFNYSKVNFINARTKIDIVCSSGHLFNQIPSDHYHGSGCPYCWGNVKMTTKQFIEKAKQVHGNFYDYSNSIVEGSNKKVQINCKQHGKFFTTPGNHINRKSGCFMCAVHNRSLTKENFEIKANKIHNSFYTYEKLKNYARTIKQPITCPIHGTFLQTIGIHLAGSGCQKCARITQASHSSARFINSHPEYKKFPTTFYVWQFENDQHKFIKVGITIRRVTFRYAHPQYKSYIKTKILEINTTIEQAIIYERNVLLNFPRYQNWNDLTFDGKTETIDYVLLSDLLSYIDSWTREIQT